MLVSCFSLQNVLMILVSQWSLRNTHHTLCPSGILMYGSIEGRNMSFPQQVTLLVIAIIITSDTLLKSSQCLVNVNGSGNRTSIIHYHVHQGELSIYSAAYAIQNSAILFCLEPITRTGQVENRISMLFHIPHVHSEHHGHTKACRMTLL